MITLRNVSKTFLTKKGKFKALDDVSLSIKRNVIHGIIGPSGAGKSTLIRLINQLEIHDKGVIEVFDYTDLKQLNKESTRMYRKSVSMIFQGFNLLERKTVYDNIALPILLQRKLTEKDREKVANLIRLVGLEGYEESYPTQLSGGQLQRVGIARALVNDPKILLCDEPTSALDTLTIKNILDLLKSIQRELNLTIIIVTHDMNVIKEVCEYVTVMDQGRIVENDTIDNIIFNPQNAITKSLLDTVGFNLERIITMYSSKKNLYLLRFTNSRKQESIISNVSISTKVRINILFANITPSEQGIMLVSLEVCNHDVIENVIRELKEEGVAVKHV
ncbi:Methionine import ATP-binding protein MetN 2 [Candidatus Izimaplasma bacterium HR1]|jgi:D-methionine transport system ATP-binding protein|uniref:methionine ABC transporter ATP-binding protein n=1 Tax=Candidatus Izimoplasma sp. HR1 TaxID=1541959 RepID=UPI0004F7D443|nr:Methionine import ATP-binding protein MetN 2 [Candidatus Izimaplasma bacterium HR1]